ncbi:MAG: hypothetical protein IH872_00470 [Chloroflexi bacterium]|nr:hypothetical protein [Chloroflexota bacterium]
MAKIYVTLSKAVRDGSQYMAMCKETGTPAHGSSKAEAEDSLRTCLQLEFDLLVELDRLGDYISEKNLKVSDSRSNHTAKFGIDIPDTFLQTPGRVSIANAQRA